MPERAMRVRTYVGVIGEKTRPLLYVKYTYRTPRGNGGETNKYHLRCLYFVKKFFIFDEKCILRV